MRSSGYVAAGRCDAPAWISGSRVSNSAFRFAFERDPGCIAGPATGPASTSRAAPATDTRNTGIGQDQAPRYLPACRRRRAERDLPAVRVPQHKAIEPRKLPSTPIRECASRSSSQIVVMCAPHPDGPGCGRGRESRRRPRRSRTVRRRLGEPAVRAAVLAVSVGDHQDGPGATAGATSGLSRSSPSVDRTSISLSPCLARCHPFARGHDRVSALA